MVAAVAAAALPTMGKRPFQAVLVVGVIGAAIVGWLLLSSSPAAEQSQIIESLEAAPAPTVPETSDPAPGSAAAGADDPAQEEDFPAIVDNALRNVDEREIPIDVALEVLETFDHDTGAFTQGFELSDGRLFESTGLVGQSTIREVDLETGDVLRSADLPDVFGEGVTVIEDDDESTAIMLTWRDEVAFRFDLETFEELETFSYSGQGWGICHDGERLTMSNGSDVLQFRDPDSFELLDEVNVTLSGTPVLLINELECVGEAVWANIWQSSLVIQIDPATGNVTRVLNASDLTPPGFEGNTNDVLNGIAYDETNDTYLLTGKRWPVTYRVRLFDVPSTN